MMGLGVRLLSIGLVLVLAVTAAWSVDLTFEERVQAEMALELVRQSHRGTAVEPSTSREVSESRVRRHLAESSVLDSRWNRPLTESMLDAELRRMIEHSRLPDRLREYFAALGDDPLLIREALVRPVLVRRLTRGFFRNDRAIHADRAASIESIHDALVGGELDPALDHPLRFVVDDADAVGFVAQSTEAFHTDAMFTAADGRSLVARYVVRKLAWDNWWPEIAASIEIDRTATVSTGTPSPVLTAFLAATPTNTAGTEGACADGTWNNASLDDVPDPRRFATAVWSGSEMIVFGGYNGSIALGTGGRYDPAIDHWEPLSNVDAPQERYLHTAVWSGTQMIVFGGWTRPAGGETNTGGAYDPVSDSWSALTETGAPSARRQHTAVWSGSEMIVWGGQDLDGNGGRYDPVSDSWTPTSLVDAPSGRSDHSAVWTGSEMIVWGGGDNFFPSTIQNTGGRYNPATDSWTPTSIIGAPQAREEHSAVWSGTQMIVWGGTGGGGILVSGGGVYDPLTNAWTPTSATNAPEDRRYHTAVWSGGEMIVWGGAGLSGPLDSGGRYDPSSGTWIATTTAGAPSARTDATGVWTGSEMIVWSGIALRDTNNGGRYDPVSNGWTPTSVGDGPTPRRGHSTVWTGNEMIVWGGSAGPQLATGGRYDPALDSWSDLSTTGAPGARVLHTAVWSGSEMIVWGGMGLGTSTGGRYDPVGDSWIATSIFNAPQARRSHSAIWTGSEMIVWGGIFSPTRFDTGGRYDPSTNIWTPSSNDHPPSARNDHSAVWTGSEMIVWGGFSDSGNEQSGSRYDPVSDVWVGTTNTDAPTARVEHSAVWTGNEMIVWGGTGPAGPTLGDGGRFDPALDSWTPMEVPEAAGGPPSSRRNHEAVWSGSEMIVWGGRIPGQSGLPDEFPRKGGRYDPSTDAWSAVTNIGAPSGRHDSGTVWTGEELIVWGGANGALVEVASGGRYCGCASSTFYRDLDGDGFGDADESVSACVAPSGFVANPDDCNDGNGSIWSTPGEVIALGFDGPAVLSWSPPVEAGGTSPLYDVVRSDDPTDFVTSASCISIDDPSTSATDTDDPLSSGAVFHYLVRAENDCNVGQGPVGDQSDGTPRSALSCP